MNTDWEETTEEDDSDEKDEEDEIKLYHIFFRSAAGIQSMN